MIAAVAFTLGTFSMISPPAVHGQVIACAEARTGRLYVIRLRSLPARCGRGDIPITVPPGGVTGRPGPPGSVGPAGPPGSPAGLRCWDGNGNGASDVEEDDTGEGAFDTRDCEGAAGPTGARGPAGPPGAAGATGATGSAGAAGATGARGPAGPQGPEGSPATTVCTAQIGGSGTAASFCATACNGAAHVVASASNYQAGCTVTSDNGSCSAGWGTGQSSYCCTCRP